MKTSRAPLSLEQILLQIDFRFDEPSETVRQIKRALANGVSVLLTRLDVSGEIGEVRKATVLCLFFSPGDKKPEDVRTAHQEYAAEVHGEPIMELGHWSKSMDRIMDALKRGCDVHLVPEHSDSKHGAIGLYTLHVLDFSVSEGTTLP